jgi:cytochrome P450
MALHPDIMRRAQQDIDTVVGRERMPNFGDWDHLPYVHAIVKETLRWKTVVPLGAWHTKYPLYYV